MALTEVRAELLVGRLSEAVLGVLDVVTGELNPVLPGVVALAVALL
jgi:hypothetical protein